MIRVSDHALLRFLDRSAGFDVESVRVELERSFARAQAAADGLGVDTYSIHSEGLLFIVRRSVVTTVLNEMSAGARFAALAPRDDRS